MELLIKSQPRIDGLLAATVDDDSWEELSHCPLCEQETYVRDIGILEGRSVSLVTAVCLDCEYGFRRRRPSAAWIEKYYAEDWDHGGQAKSKQGELKLRPRPKVFDFCASYLPEKAHVVDLGVGFGGFLEPFRAAGHHVQAVELSSHRAEFVRESLGIPCSSGPIESAEWSESANLVYLNHVLEHIGNPLDVVLKIAARLPEGGLFYVAVPNYWQEYPPQAFHFAPHLSLFTEKSLERLFAKAGLRVVKQAVTKEIQILGMKDGTASFDQVGVSDDASRKLFWEQSTQNVLNAFGTGGSARSIVWFKAKDKPNIDMESHVFEHGSSALRLLDGMAKLEPITPLWLKRILRQILPRYLTAEPLRMLSVEGSDNASLPVLMRYGDKAPIWIK